MESFNEKPPGGNGENLESEIESAGESLAETVKEIREYLDGLQNLSDEEIERLMVPGTIDKTIALFKTLEGGTGSFGTGFGLAMGVALMKGGPRLEKMLTMIMVGIAPTVIRDIVKLFNGSLVEEFKEKLGDRIDNRLMRENEKKSS